MTNDTVLNNRYRLVAQQGSGGMAVIYKAIDQALGRTVAVKILRPSLTNDPAFLARFRNEARSVANLAHPNIVTVHDVGNDGSTHYIVMEFVEGLDLKRIIKTEGALAVERALNLATQICAGIGFAHRAGLVHADVKPQNILVTRDDVVKVTDFGIAQALSDTQPGERQAVVWGSPHYFAPEQARGEKPTPASDVYSIGIVIFEMLTGRLPYTGKDQQELALAHIREPVPTVTQFNPTVPESLSRIVFKTMSKEPASRYRMADQLGHILLSYKNQFRESGAGAGASRSQPAQSAPPVDSASAPAWVPTATPPPPAPPPVRGQGGTSLPYPPAAPGIPPAVDRAPTQRYDLAPNAPQAPAYNRPAVAPNQAYQDPYQVPQSTGSTGAYYSQPLYDSRRQAPASSLDIVTIALAVLAFFAVACLIPLYIAVFQARFGG
ncbi:MAG: protein kinase [Aggregatilineales bacterium]